MGKIEVRDAEAHRLAEDARRERNWKRWGPYLSERQWGTVREDYSPDGSAWEYFPHDHARSRAYRWGEDGLLGVKKEERERRAKLVILGSGPAGLTAALYAGRAALQPVLVAGKDLGGQLFTTTQVENYPGFPDGVLGPKLMERMLEQAHRFGTDCIPAEAEAVDLSRRPFTVRLSNDITLLAEALIIATGASPRELGVKGERELWGYGAGLTH